jgi:ribonuclease Z
MAQRKVATGCGLVAVLLVAALVVAFAMRERIMLALFDRAVATAMTPQPYAKDGLHILFCGTGSPLPGGDRGEACTAVIADGKLFIFDAGEGAGRTLMRMQAPIGAASGVFLTHLHSDHINGLGNLALQRWVGSTATAPLPLAGPPGTAQVGAAFNAAYALDAGYRTAHHGERVAPSTGAGFVPRDVAPGIVYDAGGVRITAFAVRHDPVSPAYGYRLDWDGRSVTISGDTAATPALAKAAVGTDVLVAELLNPMLVKRMSATAAGVRPARARQNLCRHHRLSHHPGRSRTGGASGPRAPAGLHPHRPRRAGLHGIDADQGGQRHVFRRGQDRRRRRRHHHRVGPQHHPQQPLLTSPQLSPPAHIARAPSCR